MTQPKLAKPTPRKACEVRVRKGAGFASCNTQLVDRKDYGPVCPNRELHVNPVPTGFCHSGWHEGMKIDKPTCRWYLTCSCDCHTNLSRMYEMTETERVLVDNSTYVPDRGSFVMVDRTEIITERVTTQPNVRVVASTSPLAPDVIEKTFAATPTGRAARGQLEARVRTVTDIWVTEFWELCTPQFVARRIAELEGVPEPSTGAIDAVFKRWASIGFAIINFKPTRFVRYTEEGIAKGLEVMKEQAKYR